MVEMASKNGQNEAPARAIQFVNLQNNEIQITEEAMEFLGSLPCDQKISIVTIVGSINSGKSSLANRLVGATEDGFQVRENTQSPESQKKSKTKGIMIWSKPIKLKDGVQLLVLDMQGLPQPAPVHSSSSLRSPRASALRSPRGFAVSQRSSPTDRLLSFVTLISSLIVYAHYGSTPDQIIESLEPIAKFSDQIQKEIGGELGAKASILSTNSMGNMSARSYGNSSVLDITHTVASDLKDIVCSSLLCVLKDFTLTENQISEGITLRKSAKAAFEKSFTPSSGVTNETIRKNKTLECLKTIFPHRAVISVVPTGHEQGTTQAKDLSKLVSTIKRKASFKTVCGKALNANMFLALSLEYAETLSQPSQNTSPHPGAKNPPMHSLLLLFQAFGRVSEEETMRISDTVLAEFELELNSKVNEQTMPLSEKILAKTFKKLECKYKAILRKNLAEIATFEEIMIEADKMDERMRQFFDSKHNENYSQGYYLTLGLLKQLYNAEFSSSQEPLSSSEFKEKWLNFTNQFKFNSGEESEAKWDVFAECFIRLPIEEQNRFVDYSKVENEQAVDLANETDTMMTNESSVSLPTDLLTQQIQMMQSVEQQIEQMKRGFQEKLTEIQVQAQKVLQNHQELDKAKRENEIRMDLLQRQNDELIQQKNEMELKIQAVDREKEEIERELHFISEVTEQEQIKHKAQIEKQSGIAESELAEYGRQAENLREQLKKLDEQLLREEKKMRIEISHLENEIQTSRDEMDQMEQALAHKDASDCTQQVNQFFGHEVPEQYLSKMKELFGNNTQEAKDLKLKLFEEQREINDLDYQYTQEQLHLKQRLDEEFKQCKQKKEKELLEVQNRFDIVRQRHLEFTQKKESIDYQLQAAMRSIEELQEDIIGLNEAKQEIQQRINEDLSKIVALKEKLTQGGDGMEKLEHQIYELSIQNRIQLEMKERLIELISEVVKSSQRGKPTPEMIAIIQSLPDERNKNRLESILLPRTGNGN